MGQRAVKVFETLVPNHLGLMILEKNHGNCVRSDQPGHAGASEDCLHNSRPAESDGVEITTCSYRRDGFNIQAQPFPKSSFLGKTRLGVLREARMTQNITPYRGECRYSIRRH